MVSGKYCDFCKFNLQIVMLKNFYHTKIFLFFQLCKNAVKFLLAMAFTLFAMMIVYVALSSFTTQTYLHNLGGLQFFAPSFFIIYIKFMLIYNFKCIFYKQKYDSPYFFIKFAPVNTIIIKIHRCLNFFRIFADNTFISIQSIDANT